MGRPERQLTPDRSARHRFGYELRELRKSRRLSQDKLGKLVHVSGDLVRLIELGERQPTRRFAETCDLELDAGDTLRRLFLAVEAEAIRGGHTDNPTVGTDSAIAHVPSTAPDETISVEMLNLAGETVLVTINRRAFVGGVAGLPAVLFLGGTAGGAPNVTEGNLSDVLRDMAKLRTLLSAQDNTLGPGVVLPTAVQQVSILQRIGQTTRGKARNDVMSLQSAYGEFCGWLADDLGDHRAGQHWIDRALDWGHESDDEIQTGYVLMRKAQRAADAADSAAAVGLAKAAVRAGDLPPRIVAAARQYEAQGHALNGDRAAFEKAIETAKGIVADVSVSSGDGRAAWCTPAYVAVHEAAGLMRLNSPAEAAARYQSALVGWSDDMQRDHGIYRSRLGSALAAAKKPNDAAIAGRAALDIAQRTGSSRILAELLPLAAALNDSQTSPLVREFITELRSVVAARATIPGVTAAI